MLNRIKRYIHLLGLHLFSHVFLNSFHYCTPEKCRDVTVARHVRGRRSCALHARIRPRAQRTDDASLSCLECVSSVTERFPYSYGKRQPGWFYESFSLSLFLSLSFFFPRSASLGFVSRKNQEYNARLACQESTLTSGFEGGRFTQPM